MPAGASTCFQLNCGSVYCECSTTNSRPSAWSGVSGIRSGPQRNCWRFGKSSWCRAVVSICLNSWIRSTGPMIWIHQVDLVERVLAVLLGPKAAPLRVEGHAEAVADAVGKDVLDVRRDLAADLLSDLEEGVVLGGGPVVAEPQDHPGEMSVVRLRTTELVIGNSWTGWFGRRAWCAASHRTGPQRRRAACGD